MPVLLDPIEFYRVRLRFLTAEEGGRRGPIHWTFASYRPDFKIGEGDFHGAVLMDAPSEIALGDRVEVEIAFWCCNSKHEFAPGDAFYQHEGPKRIAEGTILEKGVKRYLRPDLC
jgi:hypothetical protein